MLNGCKATWKVSSVGLGVFPSRIDGAVRRVAAVRQRRAVRKLRRTCGLWGRTESRKACPGPWGTRKGDLPSPTKHNGEIGIAHPVGEMWH